MRMSVRQTVGAIRVSALERVRGPTPDSRFVIFGTGRSGSQLLVDLVGQHPDVICDGELLAQPQRFPLGVVRLAADGAARRGARSHGFKLLAYQLRALSRPGHDLLGRLHETGTRLVHIDRSDALRRALSNMSARRTGWHRRTSARHEHEPFHVDPGELAGELGWFEKQHAIETEALGSLPRLALMYEPDLQQRAAHQATADRLFEWIGVRSVPVETRLQKLLPHALDEVVSNPTEMKAWLRRSPWSHLVDK